ncbi:MAG: efflux RND transporter periplasmic adaptor subunit [Prolixibacteraceae bacterium]|jgi:multidrug efflux pump subunit AcrA (membrane-fusion protein)|nr:efflux RND transporter periplasmic adaptor subunit [Prolixibacteraceae bacterium]MDD4754819.1 efflux RND transporter periplasmic adaptor subunit [Prolixibacteraceae bacterium]NLO01790.1 HlyD family efflux transporter periplasmic adaptor subunit [Bacteroidales bacterium]
MSLKKKSIIGIIAGFVVVALAVIFGGKSLTAIKAYTVEKTTFESVITVKGEIQGKEAVLISLPDDLKNRDLRIHEYKIKDLIQEGRLVKKGDWIATLDIENITQQTQSNNDEIDKLRVQLNEAKIDSSIELKRLREEIEEFTYDLEYQKLELEQAKYESPAYQRKVNVAYNKTLRQMEKKKRDYELRKMHLRVRTQRIEDHYNSHLFRDSLLKKAVIAAEIHAPQDGMVIYTRVWGGRKLRIGDNISPWRPVIATLPDLSVLVSDTYVEEIHITKINLGDSAKITIDAIPGKVFNGVIYKIANIGQELTGFESKVFNVLIELTDNDPELKPAMTSNNNIIINKIPDVLTVPRECLFAENNVNYVYIRKAGKVIRQPVTPGPENEKEVIIRSGLEVNDKVLLSEPEQFEQDSVSTQDLDL